MIRNHWNSMQKKLFTEICAGCVLLAACSTLTSFSEKYQVDDMTIETVKIPSGVFMMGNNFGDEDEKPMHEVTLDSFEIGKYEITVEQFQKFVMETKYKKGRIDWMYPDFRQTPQEPAVKISWYDAQAFCQWLSNRTGENFRLPTEAEWEYTAMAGEGQPNSSYERIVFINKLENQSWNSDNAGREVSRAAYQDNPVNGQLASHKVGSKQPNAWGVYDMVGNAWEWTLDVYYPKHRILSDGAPNTRDDLPEIARRYVLKGGSYKSYNLDVFPAYRSRSLPNVRGDDVGFRIVKGKQYDLTANEEINKHKKFDATSVQVDGLDIEVIKVKPCKFIMGGTYSPAPKWFDYIEKQEIHIEYEYYIGKYEITREQFSRFVDDFGYVTDAEKERKAMLFSKNEDWRSSPGTNWKNLPFVQEDDHPASCVSWHDAMYFCKWLSEKSGCNITLPTITEWECACRAGTGGDFSGTGQINDMGWCDDNSNYGTHAVGLKEANDWGIYDMHGNVWEWNLDMWQDGFPDLPKDGSAWMKSKRFIAMESGGSFGNPSRWCASHIHIPSGWRNFNHGFRIVIKN